MRRWRYLLIFLAGVMLLGSVLLPAWALLTPINETLDAVADRSGSRNPTSSTQQRRLPELAQMQDLWSRPLRAPLFDPPVDVSTVETTPEDAPRHQFSLLGTMIEKDRPVALFVSDGHIVTRGIGQTIDDSEDGPRVLDITPGAAVVLVRGERVSIEIERTAQ